MKTVWKVLLGLAVVIPLTAYVVGSLAASAADDPAPRHTIEIREPSPSSTPSHTPSHSPRPSVSPSSSPTPEVEVITPSYDDLGDDHGGDGNSGHGGGDDSSGHGSSGHGGGRGED